MEKTQMIVLAAVVILAAAVAAYFAVRGPHEVTPSPSVTTQPRTTAPPHTTKPPKTTAPPEATTAPPETTQPPQVTLRPEGTLCDLVKTVEERGWRYEDSNGTWMEVRYAVKGRESVGGVQALKIEITGRGSEAEEQTAYFWLDTTACSVVQIQMPDGSVLTGPLADQAGRGIITTVLWPIVTSEGIAANVVAAERSHWEVSWSDLGFKTVGGQRMHVVRYEGSPLPGSEDYGEVSRVTVEVGDLGGGLWLVTYMRVEYPNGSWVELKVTEL